MSADLLTVFKYRGTVFLEMSVYKAPELSQTDHVLPPKYLDPHTISLSLLPSSTI